MNRGRGAFGPARAATPGLPPAEALAHLPAVALVGRPNTGKSTLFNRLTRSRRAVVASSPGVTRDRNIALTEWGGRRFLLIDTGGFETADREDLAKAVQAQSLLAAGEADAVIVVLDGRAGLNPLDAALIDRLRPLPKPLFVAVNKIDTPKQEHLQSDFYALGVDALYPISAEHGLHIGRLMDAVVAQLPETESPPGRDEAAVAAAIIGRPNVGKSSLLNRLVGQERVVVAPAPGTTRDAIDTPVTRDGRHYVLVDTAGVRRRPRVHAEVERASVVRALRALERAEIGVLVIDAIDGVTDQDVRLAGYAWERGRALLAAINKWDMVPDEGRDPERFARAIDRRYPSLAVVPKVFVSALTGQGVERIWPLLDALAARHRAAVPTARLNQVLTRAARQQPPPIVKGRRARFFYAAQTATAPPTVTVFASAPECVPAVYERYLINQIRAAFDLEGVPVRVRFRPRERRAAPARRRAPTRQRAAE